MRYEPWVGFKKRAVTTIYVIAFIGFHLFLMNVPSNVILQAHVLTSLPTQFGVVIPCFTSHGSKQVFNYTLIMALLTGAATYYAQASDLGWSVVSQSDHLTRQIFYARYINWVVSFLALVLSLGLLSGVSWTTIIWNISIAWFCVLSYPAAAYTTTSYKWRFVAFGTFA